jgi:hypothetical protein
MEFKVGDRVRLPDGQEGTVASIEGERIFLKIKTALNGYIRAVTLAEIEPPLDPTQPPPDQPVD